MRAMRLAEVVVATLLAGPTVAGAQTPYLVKAGSDTGVHGLWSSDGTPAGTTLVSDFPTAGDLLLCDFAALNGILYFAPRSPRPPRSRASGGATAPPPAPRW
jgi:hypothetical protein